MAIMNPTFLELNRCPHCSVDKPNLSVIGAHMETTDYLGRAKRLWRCYRCAACDLDIWWLEGVVNDLHDSQRPACDGITDKIDFFIYVHLQNTSTVSREKTQHSIFSEKRVCTNSLEKSNRIRNTRRSRIRCGAIGCIKCSRAKNTIRRRTVVCDDKRYQLRRSHNIFATDL